MSKTMKKILSLALVLSMCMTLGILHTQAEEAPRVKVGIIQLMDHPSLAIIYDSLIQGFTDEGIADRIEFVVGNAQNDFGTASQLANQFISEGCTLLLPITTPCAQAAVAVVADAQADVGVLFTAVTDPVAAGIVGQDAPAVQVTGVSDEVPVQDILDLAQQLTPGYKTVGLLYNAGEANSMAGVALARAYCQQKGIAVVEAAVANTSEVMQAAQSLAGKADICFTSNDNTIAGAMAVYAQVGLDNKLPIYVGADTMVAEGGLATIGIDYRVLGAQTARMLKDYLDGKAIADMPVEYVAGAQALINTDTAAALSITIPADVAESARLLKTGDKL